MVEEIDGVFNPSADSVKRIDETWSATNLDGTYSDKDVFERLRCRNCLGLSFEVLHTGYYETSARCVSCGMYYIVHSG